MSTVEWNLIAKNNQHRPSVWLVWTLSDGGNLTLEGVFTRPERANTCRKAIDFWSNDEDGYHGKRYEHIVRCWIEPVWTDHLIAAGMDLATINYTLALGY